MLTAEDIRDVELGARAKFERLRVEFEKKFFMPLVIDQIEMEQDMAKLLWRSLGEQERSALRELGIDLDKEDSDGSKL